MGLCLCLCASENSLRQISGFVLLIMLYMLMSRAFSLAQEKKEHVPFFLVIMLMLMSLVLCLSHKCEPGLSGRMTKCLLTE